MDKKEKSTSVRIIMLGAEASGKTSLAQALTSSQPSKGLARQPTKQVAESKTKCNIIVKEEAINLDIHFFDTPADAQALASESKYLTEADLCLLCIPPVSQQMFANGSALMDVYKRSNAYGKVIICQTQADNTNNIDKKVQTTLNKWSSANGPERERIVGRREVSAWTLTPEQHQEIMKQVGVAAYEASLGRPLASLKGAKGETAKTKAGKKPGPNACCVLS